MRLSRYLPHVFALLVTGTAGAYMPGGSPPQGVAPGNTPDTSDYDSMMAELNAR